jgi:hypothetical protein
MCFRHWLWTMTLFEKRLCPSIARTRNAFINPLPLNTGGPVACGRQPVDDG